MDVVDILAMLGVHESSEDRKKPQEHVLKRKTREDGRYVPVDHHTRIHSRMRFWHVRVQIVVFV